MFLQSKSLQRRVSFPSLLVLAWCFVLPFCCFVLVLLHLLWCNYLWQTFQMMILVTRGNF